MRNILGKKVITDLPIPLAGHNLPGLVSNIASNAANKFERKIGREEAVSSVFTLFVSNEDMTDIIKIMKSFGDSGVLIDRVAETVKHEIKKQEGRFIGALLARLVASIVKPVIS